MLEVLNENNTEVFEALVAGVRTHNHAHMGRQASQPLLVLARDEHGHLIGGVAGRTIYRQFLIEVVWVDTAARASGLGRRLMSRAEAEARSRACLAAQVDTLSFQAPVFYEKLGFEVVGKVAGIPESPDRYFLLKRYA